MDGKGRNEYQGEDQGRVEGKIRLGRGWNSDKDVTNMLFPLSALIHLPGSAWICPSKVGGIGLSRPSGAVSAYPQKGNKHSCILRSLGSWCSCSNVGGFS